MRFKILMKRVARGGAVEITAGAVVILISLLIFPGVHLGNLVLQLVAFSVLIALRIFPPLAIIPPLISSALWFAGIADHSMLSGILAYIAIEYAVARGRCVIASIIAAQWLIFGYIITRDMNPRLDDLPAVIFEFLCFSGAAVIGYFRASTNRKEKRQQAVQQQLQYDLRASIARYLHDNMARTLTMISMHAELARANIDDHDTQGQLDKIADSGRSAIEDLRQLVSHLLYTQSAETEAALGSWNTASVGTSISSAIKMLRGAGYNLNYTGDPLGCRLPREVETAFVLAFNEVTANLVKHSPPNADVNICTANDGQNFTVVVSNSRGTDVQDNSGMGSGIGMGSITARMLTVGGFANFVTTTERWQVTLSVPIINERKKAPC